MKISFDINKERINEFLARHPRSNIFQTPVMCQVYKKTKNLDPVFLSVVNNDNKILGILLAVIQKEHRGFLGKLSARSIIWGGPLVKDNNPLILEFLLSEYNKIIKKKAIYSQFRNLWEWSDDEKKVFEKNDFRYEPHLDILFDLNKSENDLLKEMHKGRRKNIRRSMRIPLDFEEIESNKDFDICIQLIEQTYKRVKLPFPDKTFFYAANDKLRRINGLKKFAVKYKGKIISARLSLCYNDIVYDWYAGTDENFLDLYPNDYLPWVILKWAKANGYKTFDFGGAGKPNVSYGVRDFKMKFGGDLVEFGRFEKVHQPILMKMGRKGFKLYQKFNYVR